MISEPVHPPLSSLSTSQEESGSNRQPRKCQKHMESQTLGNQKDYQSCLRRGVERSAFVAATDFHALYMYGVNKHLLFSPPCTCWGLCVCICVDVRSWLERMECVHWDGLTREFPWRSRSGNENKSIPLLFLKRIPLLRFAKHVPQRSREEKKTPQLHHSWSSNSSCGCERPLGVPACDFLRFKADCSSCLPGRFQPWISSNHEPWQNDHLSHAFKILNVGGYWARKISPVHTRLSGRLKWQRGEAFVKPCHPLIKLGGWGWKIKCQRARMRHRGLLQWLTGRIIYLIHRWRSHIVVHWISS